MSKINRRHFIAGASATGIVLATQTLSALGESDPVTKTFSGSVTLTDGFTVPAGEVWEFDSGTSTTVTVERNVVVLGTLRMSPSSSSVTHTLRFENVDESKFVGGGMEVRDSDIGLWVMDSGQLDLRGTPKTAWNRSGWDSSWLASDEVRVAPTAKGDFGADGFAPFKSGNSLPGIDIPGSRVLSFTDTSSSIFVDDIEAIYVAGITTGYGDGRFGPNDGVTRAQMAAFLVRGLGLPGGGSAGFSDVSGHWAEGDINALAAAGITTGYGDGRFGPNDGVTRAQMAAFLMRGLGLPGGGSAGFSDVSGHWAEGDINALAAAGITTGYGDGRFGPNDGVTRGQMAAFLKRGLGLAVPEVENAGSLSAEVLNLTRNVRIMGTPGGRSHVLIHASAPQTISDVEIRHVGPRDSSGEDGVLGRYGLHFHHCGDGSRGSVVSRVVVTGAGGHAFVPHMSHGISFNDCISYDTFEDAYWWDEQDASHDISWINCVAAFVRTEPEFRGFRLSGFLLGVGDRCVVKGCVAVGVQGNINASGFHWPELEHKTEGVWQFTDNLAHNNRANGIFTWQNTGKLHTISDFVAYRNGAAGVEHGAYVNRYVYQGMILVDCESGLKVHANSVANSSITVPQTFADIDISLCENAVHLTGTNGTPNQPTQFRNIRFSSNNNKVLVTTSSGTDEARRDHFSGSDIDPSDVVFEDAHSGSLFTFERPDGSSWAMDDEGNVS